jgi:hypothetical protein
MRCVLPLFAALVLFAASAAGADDVGRLIARLGSEDHGEREAAMEALANRGAEAVPALRAALDSPDAEVSRRAAEALARIEPRLEAEAVLRPRKVRLACTDTPLAEALADFSRHTGFPVKLREGQAGLVGRRLTLDTGDVPFWEAYERLLLAAGLTEDEPLPVPAQLLIAPLQKPKVVLVDDAPVPPAVAPLELVEGKESGAVFHAGSLRVRALPPRRGAGAAVGDWPLTLEVKADPRLGWEGLVRLRLERVLDGEGRAVEHGSGVVAEAVSSLAWLARDTAPAPDPHLVTVPVCLGRGTSQRLREVRGVVAVRLREPDAELARLAARADSSARSRDGGAVEVQEMTHEGDGLWQVRVRVSLPPGPEPPPGVFVVRVNKGGPHRVLLDRARDTTFTLHDAAGRPLTLATGEYVTNADETVRSYVLAFQAARDQAPATLVYSGPRSALVEVPFVLSDVPLTAP